MIIPVPFAAPRWAISSSARGRDCRETSGEGRGKSLLAPINGISALTKLYFPSKTQKIISNVLKPLQAHPLARYLVFGALFLLVASTAEAASSPRETYAEGRRLMKEEKWTKALEYFSSLEKNYPLLEDYLLFDMGGSYLKSGAVEEALAAFRSILGTHRNSPLYRKAYRKILEIEKIIDTAAALDDLEAYLREFPQDSKALWEKAGLLEKVGRPDEAMLLLKEIFLSGSLYALKSYEALKKRDYQAPYEEIRKAAQRLSEKGNHGQVVSLLEGRDVQDEEGRYLLGKAYFRLRQYRNAIKTLTGVPSQDGCYLLAISFLRVNEKEAFYRLSEELTREGQQEWFSLHNLTAEQLRREGKAAACGDALQAMVKLYPEREEEITWSQAWFAIRQNRLPEAEKLLDGLTNTDSKERDKYVFWLGKVKTYQGKNAKAVFARIRDKTGYYWFRAGNGEAKAGPGSSVPGVKKENGPPLSEEMNRRFLRISELESLKMRAEAGEEARLVMGTVTEAYVPAFAKLLTDIEDYATLVRFGIRYNYPTIKYPLAFRDAVLRYSQANRVDPLLVMSIMREESRFRRDAVSSAGARGVMQLMPATAKRLGVLKNDDELFDAEKNIKLGTSYLSKLLAQLKVPHYAVAAYNAGEHNVAKWLAAEYRDEDEFTEDIPFGETKTYVFRVMQTYGIMKSLYGKELKN